MPGLHATLSASGAKRWMSCPPSARLEERLRGIFGEKSTPFAEEGTKAHSLAELKLLREKGRLSEDDGINDFNYDLRRKALALHFCHFSTDIFPKTFRRLYFVVAHTVVYVVLPVHSRVA